MRLVPPERAVRRDPASSVASVSLRYEGSLRPWLAPPIAPRTTNRIMFEPLGNQQARHVHDGDAG
jgi:hypothetical protein